MHSFVDDYFDSDEFKDILNEFENGTSVDLDVDDMIDIADYYYSLFEDDKAKAVINDAVEKYPGESTPLLYKTREALEKEDLVAACDYAERMIDKSGSDYCYAQAEILISQDRIDEADALLGGYYDEMAAEEQGDFIFDVGEIYVDYGVYDKAYKWLALSSDRNDIEYKELLGETLFNLQRFDKCEECYNELIDLDAFNIAYWNALASAQAANGKYEEAISSCVYALAIDPGNASAMLTKAGCLTKQFHQEEALILYERYREKHPDDASAWLNVGSCLTNIGRYDEAIKSLDKAFEMCAEGDKERAYICQELAFAHFGNGDNDTALRYIRKCEEIDYDHTEVELLRAHILLSMGLVTSAQTVFEDVMEKNDNDPEVALRMIISLYDNHHLRAAYMSFKRLFTREPDFKEGFSYMALCCYDLRKRTDFLKYLALAVETNPYEVRRVLDGLFPEGMDVGDYYEYAKANINFKKTT